MVGAPNETSGLILPRQPTRAIQGFPAVRVFSLDMVARARLAVDRVAVRHPLLQPRGWRRDRFRPLDKHPNFDWRFHMGIWRSAPPSDKRLFFVSMFCLVGSLTALGMRETKLRAAGGDEEFYRFTDVAAQVYSEIRSKYVEEVDDKEILEAALRGMTSILDEHSQYMPPDRA
jgi:hypothetical protein